MCRRLRSILVILIITVFIGLIIHPLSVNAAREFICKADKAESDLARNMISSTLSLVLMQIKDSRLATDPKQVMIEKQLANHTLGGLIDHLKLDPEDSFYVIIQELKGTRSLLNNDNLTQAANKVTDLNARIYKEASKCPY